MTKEQITQLSASLVTAERRLVNAMNIVESISQSSNPAVLHFRAGQAAGELMQLQQSLQISRQQAAALGKEQEPAARIEAARKSMPRKPASEAPKTPEAPPAA